MEPGGSGPSVGGAEEPKAPPPPATVEPSELPKSGEITEAQAATFPDHQKVKCSNCGALVTTPIPADGQGPYEVKCSGCGTLNEAIPF